MPLVRMSLCNFTLLQLLTILLFTINVTPLGLKYIVYVLIPWTHYKHDDL